MGTYFYGALTLPTHLIDADVEEQIELEGVEEREEVDGLTALTGLTRYGEYEDLEKYLVSRKIPFDRDSEAYTEFEAETVFYRPDRHDKPITVTVTASDADFFVLADQLKPLLNMDPEEAMVQLKALLDERAPEFKSIYEYVDRATQVEEGAG